MVVHALPDLEGGQGDVCEASLSVGRGKVGRDREQKPLPFKVLFPSDFFRDFPDGVIEVIDLQPVLFAQG